MIQHVPVHPKKERAKILLASVFGPYARDDEFGSREINPMELYQNQVTRFQGIFSLRMFHRSFGLMLIQANIQAPCTLLDFPDKDRFVAEIKARDYDVVGISGIIPNIGKVVEMCRLVRRYLPRASIVVGGHVTNKEDIHQLVDADHIVKGDGVAWFRRYLGADPEAPVNHPMAYSGNGTRILGTALKDRPGETAAVLIPSVGCPVGCNFCSTSALFGGKGHFLNFYETGEELFAVMAQLEKKLKVRSFFVLDENFLLHRKRALRLLELMEKNNKSWSMYVFSSARVLKSYTMEQLVGLGISWVWMGLEGENSQYAKLGGINVHHLVKDLQANGIRVLGSSIVGLEDHCPENMDKVIEYAVSYNTDFHQFMLYTPNPGTPLYAQHKADGTLLGDDRFNPADAHGQFRFNYRHKHIKDNMEEEFLRRAFERDFEKNGPSLARLIRSQLAGYLKHKNHPDPRVRRRILWECRSLGTTYTAAVWAMRKWFDKEAGHPNTVLWLERLMKNLYKAFGMRARLSAPLAGRYLYRKMIREQERLARGWSYEPPVFYEKNEAALALEAQTGKAAHPAAAPAPWTAGETRPA